MGSTVGDRIQVVGNGYFGFPVMVAKYGGHGGFYRPISSIFLPPILLFNCKFPNDSDKCLKSHLIIRGTFEMCGTWKIRPREALAMHCPQGIVMFL